MTSSLLVWKERNGIADGAFAELLLVLSNPVGLTNYDLLTHDATEVATLTPGFIPSPSQLDASSLDPSVPFLDSIIQWPEARSPQDFIDGAHYMHEPNMRSDPQSMYLLQSTQVSTTQELDRSCVRCSLYKKKCRASEGSSICIQCATPSVLHLCIRVRLADNAVFAKWRHVNYASQLVWKDIPIFSPIIQVPLQHFHGGPVIKVDCCEFQVSTPQQTQLFFKSENGWATMWTAPYALARPLQKAQIENYIECHVDFLYRAEESWTSLATILSQLVGHPQDPLARSCLYLWSAHRLLMKGWSLVIPGSLNTWTVEELGSTLYGTAPAPRVLQNQLDQVLEEYCAEKEFECLKLLHKAMYKKRRKDWAVVFAVSMLLLHLRERDLWRLLYWTLGNDGTYTWRHPEKPKTLVRKSIHESNMLLAHLHFSGDIPTEFEILKHNLQAYSTPAKDRYHWLHEYSVDNSLSSAAFLDRTATFQQVNYESFGC